MKSENQKKMAIESVFREKLLKMIKAEKKESKYLTEAHKKNSEAAKKQITEWKKSSIDIEETLKRQKEREKLAKELESKNREN